MLFHLLVVPLDKWFNPRVSCPVSGGYLVKTIAACAVYPLECCPRVVDSETRLLTFEDVLSKGEIGFIDRKSVV